MGPRSSKEFSMTRLFALFSLVLALSACLPVIPSFNVMGVRPIAEFWRPISEPNILLPPQRAQQKLMFDLSQCNCGIFPRNVEQPDLIAFQPDRQRYAETSITRTADGDYSCIQRPSLVVSECMRVRGWEPTVCSGRMPLASGGSTCAAAIVEDE
jgi:hypothetical protein